MKSKILVEIESPDSIEIFPVVGQTEEDFKGKEQELQVFREQYCKDLHNELVVKAKEYFDLEQYEDEFIDELEELYIEDLESFDDYKIKINTKVERAGETK